MAKGGRADEKNGVICLVLCSCWLFAGQVSGDEKPKEVKIFKATVGDDGVQHVENLGGGYFFTPSRVIVKVNIPVELKVRKESGIVPHDIVVKAPEAAIDFDIALSDEPKSISFTPLKTGTYPFYCNKKLLFFESHREKGMEGYLEVIE
jgi:plastocyanin domain-containing protein